MMGRENCGEGEKQLMSQSTPHHLPNMVEAILLHRYVQLPVELVKVFIDLCFCDC